MSSIPVYVQSPINATTAGDVGSKKTAAPPTEGTRDGPSINTATTTAIPSSISSYPATRPGAPAMPAPTGAVQRYASLQPTRTTEIEDVGPPPPQPGAFPAPPKSMRSSLPPPPKAGKPFYHPPPQRAMHKTYPQVNVPLLNTASSGEPSSSSISATTTSSSAHPLKLPSDECGHSQRGLQHPSGYIQNPNISNASSEQRRALDSQNSADTGIYEPDKLDTLATFGADAGSVWNTAKAWASSAGKKLSEVESEVWKRVNGEK